MIRYMTRHGQVTIEADDPSVIDRPISELGKRQSALLGERMREVGFCGKIICSPCLRALQTAEIIAEHTGSVIIPFSPFRERLKNYERALRFYGMDIEKIKALFPHVDAASALEYPWWEVREEDAVAVTARVKAGMDILEKLYPDEPLLFVCHGANIVSLHEIYGIQHSKIIFNCALSAIDNRDSSLRMVCDASHLPYSMQTYNQKTRQELELLKMI